MEEVGCSIGPVAFMELLRVASRSIEATGKVLVGTRHIAEQLSTVCLAFFIMFNFLNVFAGENLVNLQCISHLPLCIQVRDIFWNITWQNLKHAGRGSFPES